MKRLLILLITHIVLVYPSMAQKHELGIHIGTANMLSDLGGANHIGSPLLRDLELGLFRPAVGIFYRYSMHSHISFRAGAMYAKLIGDDALTDYPTRKIRNLSAETNLIELYAVIELYLLKYAPGSLTHRFTPYVAGGIGGFYFNPKVRGTSIALQPLGTEGQGMPGYPDKYALVQPCIPFIGGFKLNVSSSIVLGAEISYRFLLTDYLDDVSTNYVGLQEFIDYYGTEQGTYIFQIANPETNNEIIHGEQRGDSKNNDQYFSLLIDISYVFGASKKGKNYSRNKMPCFFK